MRKILAIATPLGFIAYVWWAGWFLRGGPNGPHNWAFEPILITGLALFIAATIALTNGGGRYLS